MSLEILVLDAGTPYSWALMPAFLSRVKKFTMRHNEHDDPLPKACAYHFGAQTGKMLAIVILDGDEDNIEDAMVGHVLCGVESVMGREVGMVYQFEKTGQSEEWRSLNKAIQAHIDIWVRTLGLDEVMAMAETDSRARLFAQFGYVRGPVLLRRKFDG